MACTISDYSIKFDEDNRIKSSINAKVGYVPTRLIIAASINSGVFHDWAYANNEAYKKAFDEKGNIAAINKNTLKSVIDKYADYIVHLERNGAEARTASALYGFTSANAKSIAYSEVGRMVKDKFLIELQKPKKEQRKRDDIINDVVRDITNELGRRTEIFVKELKEKGINNEDLQQYEILSKEIKESNNIIDSTKAAFGIETNLSKKQQLREQNKEAANKSRELKERRRALAYVIMTKYSTPENTGNWIQNKNYANLYLRTIANRAEFFDKVFSISKMLKYAKDFEGALESDKLQSDITEDDSDITNPGGENVDETTKSWENVLANSFLDEYGTRFKLYLDGLATCKTPYNKRKEGVQNDTFNELGVATYRGSNYYITQLVNISNCASVNSLIDSIKNAANTIPDLYALGALVDDMIANPIFANYIYTEIHQFKLKKAIITIGNNSIDFARSNSDSEVYANLFMQMLDEARTSFKSAFNIVDNIKIKKYLNPSFTARLWKFAGSKEQKEIVNFIVYYIGKYFPSIDKQSVEKYLTSDKENSSRICGNMLRAISDFNVAMSDFITAYNEATLSTNKEFKEYREKVKAGNEIIGEDVYLAEIEKPTYEFPEDAYRRINVPVMTIARYLSKSIAVKTELNHQNAEGHLSSDLTGNSFISNFLEQIRYTVEQTERNRKGEVIYKGLENLLKEVKLSKQFENNPILFGVKDINGKVIIPGLFVQDGLDWKVNSNAEKLFDVFLFDGVKESNNDGITYTKMSPSDYLISVITAYHSATDIYLNTEHSEDYVANYFMRIPSDAPKNFTIQTIRVGMKDLTGINQEEYSKWKVDYYTEIGKQLATNNKFMTFGEVPSNDSLIKTANAKVKNNQFNRNKVNAETIINILTNNGLYNISENAYQVRRRSNEIVDIPIVFNLEPSEYQRSFGEDGINITIMLSGVSKNGFIEHAEINGIYSYDSVLNTVGLPQRNVKRELIRFFESEEVDNYLYRYADDLGLVNRSINRDSKGFAAFYQHLEQDIKTFVDQLNNILEWSDEENAYISKLNTDGLFEFAHYKKGKIVEVGKNGVARFSGNLFQFTKLFDVNGVNGNNEISNEFSLYGGTDSIFTSFTDKDGNIRLKLSKPVNELFTVDRNGFLALNTAIKYVKHEGVTERLSNIIDKWLTEYTIALGETYNQYKELIPDSLVETANDKREYNDRLNKKELFLDAMFGQTWALMSFDDIFEGHSGFYKDAQTHLKRAKEVQMAGKSYAAQNKDIVRFNAIEDIKDYDGQEIEIKVKQPGDIDGSTPTSYIVPTRVVRGIENKPMTVRNGFRGVTIRNTVRPYDLVEDLYRQLKENLSKQFDEKTADDLANTIADGYRANAKLNDAQSYITFEEWIRRRHADGTLDEYQDLIEQLLDESKPVEEIDLQGIAKRIQPQKNVYYDFQYDPVTKTVYPRQIKNSEFVLIPRLLPKDSDLRKLYDIMKRNDIGQINTAETDKAAKHYILEFWDKNSVAHPEEFEAAIRGQVLKDGKWTGQYNDKVIEKYYYRYLYKQQDVVDHIKDEENKAGIQIMKKIIDNASSASLVVRKHVSNFEKAYAANIQDSFNKMLFNMGWQVDENGRLVNRPKHHKDPITGEVTTKQSPVLNFTEFWKKAKVEAQRLGMNSQFMEFLTPNEFGNPNMPNWFSNVSVKIESIAQAIFNNQITRQTLPGWHAAQITQIGYSKELKYHPTVYSYIGDTGKKITINQEEYNKLSDEEKNKYTKTEEAYAEVYLPRWSNLIPKGKTKEEEERILKQIQEEGLDIQIGYRIPSEGKQSVSKLKVVGFLPDAYGSTIMLPDAWVIQTGSDFNIDSVYGIYYEMYRDKDGNVRKIQFDDLTNDTIERQHKRYLAYVNEQVNDRLKQDSKYAEANEYLKDVKNKLKSFDENITKSKEFGRLNKIIYDTENELKNSKDGKSVLKLINRIKKNFSKFGYSNFDISLEVIKELENSSPVEGIQPFVDALIDAYKARVELDTLRKNNDPYSESLFNYKTKDVIEKKQAAIEDYFRIVNEVAKDLGLYSFEDFIELPAEMQNTRKARNNRILDSMVGIMSDPSSLEENLSRSNFDDITEEKKVLEEMAGVSLSSMSVYNPVHQVKFMENAINGRKLKAFSVTRDTFNSVNNRIHTNVNPHEAPIVKYSKKYYNPEVIKAAYDNVEEYDDYLIVRHDKIGWSNNNKNVLGKYVTVYSSETTAHILDAIKEGALYNETDFTFGTFKTLVDVGIDYRTAIGFLMQPAITLINDKYFSTKSIYTNATGYPINMAFAEVLNKLGIRYKDKEITQYTNLAAVLSSIPVESDITETLIKYFGDSILGKKGLSNGMGVLDREVLEKRLKANKTDNIFSSEREKDIFDLGILIMFKQFYYTTKGIEKIQRLTNPDSFGALQTVNETRTKVNNARALYGFPRTTDGTPKIDQPLYVGDFFYPSTVLEAIYPGLDGDNIRVEHSKYPSLAAMFKYSTMTSVEANSKVFTLESNEFAAIYNIIQAKLGVEFKQEQYRELQKYIVSDIFNNIPILSSPVTINEHGFIVIDEEVITSGENTAYWNDEKARIFGYKETIDNFKINDINNPTPEELKEYVKLTPLQKVRFMQSNFNDDNVNALFSKLRTRIITKADKNSKGYGKNIIRFNDNADNIEDIFVFFRNCFFNKNPLIKLAAIDLVKYSFIVDGHKFAKGSISKLITNDALLANINNKGMNIVDVANKQMYTNISKSYYTDDYFIDKFVRSHSEFVNNVYLSRKKVNGVSIYQQFNMCKQQNGLVFIPSIDEFKYLMDAIRSRGSYKEYIKITDSNKGRKTETLYKIVTNESYKGLYLVPLNLLEDNEIADYSLNPVNNKFPNQDYYYNILSKIDNNIADLSELTISARKSAENKLASEVNRKDYIVPNKKPKPTKHETLVQDTSLIDALVDDKTPALEKAKLQKLVDDVNKRYESTSIGTSIAKDGTKSFLIWSESDTLAFNIPEKGKDRSIIQRIEVGGISVPFKISKYKFIRNGREVGNLFNKKAEGQEVLLTEQETALSNELAMAGNPINARIYKVEEQIDPSVLKEYIDSISVH